MAYLGGEAVIITRSGVSRRQVVPPALFAPDIFKIRVFCKARLSSRWCKRISESYGMGDALAENVQQVLTENDFTVDVIPASKRYLNQIIY